MLQAMGPSLTEEETLNRARTRPGFEPCAPGTKGKFSERATARLRCRALCQTTDPHPKWGKVCRTA